VSRPGRLGILAGLLVVVVGLVLWVVLTFVKNAPPTVNFVSGHQQGQPVEINAQTVGSIGYGVHPTWVSYLVKNPQGQWIHSTVWELPAHTRVDVTIDQYDSGSPLRNQVFGSVTGTIGGVAALNGKSYSLIDSNSGNGVGHTFTVPSLGINIPLPGVDPNANNICSQAPCDTHSVSNVISFSFTTPGPGQYPFQCFIPCGLGYLFGNGGPMQTLGYMGGFLKVVS
jgi:hypothetical protein